ncbi:MAG TPA: methylmalonyl-CoA mutase family protein, partial [Bryobacteraceae bacterium]|nr:methylmalonyl-CoA mutase family protein [Bryobacteraceae bacterium]
MAEDSPGTEILHLALDFPPVSTADWEAAIAKDLKGADYEKKLVWRTDEGIAVRPYYRREHVGVDHPSAPRAVWEEAQDWAPPADAIRADHLHEAGATSVQELGYAAAQATEMRANEPVFVFAVGSNYFFEIAKFRAARVLWASLGTGATLHIHARTARANKSVFDPYTNLLRVTTEAMSAVIGGCDSLDVEAFGFDPHLALNVQRILREEAHLGKVSDPASGSYYVETLTTSLVREATKVFEQVQADGGWRKALESGNVEKALTASRGAKAKAIASRRR